MYNLTQSVSYTLHTCTIIVFIVGSPFVDLLSHILSSAGTYANNMFLMSGGHIKKVFYIYNYYVNMPCVELLSHILVIYLYIGHQPQLTRKMVSDMFYCGELEKEIRDVRYPERLSWKFNTTNNRDTYLEFIMSFQRQQLYPHVQDKQCTERGMYSIASNENGRDWECFG